jgi:hypothetical protein
VKGKGEIHQYSIDFGSKIEENEGYLKSEAIRSIKDRLE